MSAQRWTMVADVSGEVYAEEWTEGNAAELGEGLIASHVVAGDEKFISEADYERDVAAARDKALNDAIEAVEALPGSPRGTRIGRTSALTDAVTEITALRKPVDGPPECLHLAELYVGETAKRGSVIECLVCGQLRTDDSWVPPNKTAVAAAEVKGWNLALDAVLKLPSIAYREATHSDRQAAIAALRKGGSDEAANT